MNKGVILYQSKYGATKKYAEWLKEATQFDCVETKKADIKKVAEYDVIILGGGIYASGIAGLSFLKKNIQNIGVRLFNLVEKDYRIGVAPYLFGKLSPLLKADVSGRRADKP